ncbi:efflux RND transporter permease subunit [Telmatospirillum sp.]|uniref:efflux RND transporter permease subunit n=1 Tax=Telmatospirillum sp. TaxID=2079197 RepID=UPI00284ABBBE|nr:efflux RND transporter permease subunit [Telmatospirillum sp.]MDR3438657.1 efflux RND transporter permease subunit [Telmatospirillum sp.]
MSVTELFIRRPVATTLLTIGILLAGGFAFFHLQVAPLPRLDFPTMRVQAQMAGSSPDTMAATVAAPLERHLGQIAGLTSMTSQSTTGMTQIILQFDLERDIDGAARDVQAAINAAHADLPSTLKSNPTYDKFNPADAPILMIALTSERYAPEQLYDIANNMIGQRLSQIKGVGNVQIAGSSLPAVRVDVNADALFKYGISLEDVRAALSGANANSPKGVIEQGALRWQLYANDQVREAADYSGLVVAYRNGRTIQLSDVASITDSVESIRGQGYANGKPAVLMMLFKQPNANIIETVDSAKALLPQLKAGLPTGITMTVTGDRSTTIRASLADTERTLVLSVFLVILVVFVFLRNLRATLIPSIALPVSLIGTFAAMYLCDYSLDNLSLMALTIATGFVVDDAIVVLENVTRLIEEGKSRIEAALQGAREVSFTVISMSASLIAVFLPILLMSGLLGRLFREFAAVISLAIAISLIISLTTTAALSAHVLRRDRKTQPGRLSRWVERGFTAVQDAYVQSLTHAMRHKRLVILSLLVTVALNVVLFVVVPKGLFPQQDSGLLMGGLQADQAISFQAMSAKLTEAEAILGQDPAVASSIGFTGGRSGTNSANVFVTLKPRGERSGIQQVMDRLRPKLAAIPGAKLMMFPMQDLFIGGRQSFAQFQYTLQSDSTADLYVWTPKLLQELKRNPLFTDLQTDQQIGGMLSKVVIDRQAAARFGLTPEIIDATLYDAFGERQVSTIYKEVNQYHVVMGIDPRDLESPESLNKIYLSTSGASASGSSRTNFAGGTATSGSSSSTTASASKNQSTNSIATSSSTASSGSAVSTASETMIPLGAFAHLEEGAAPVQVNHQDGFAASTISFNLATGHTLDQAVTAIAEAEQTIRMPTTVHGAFAGTAASFQSTLRSELLLIAAALIAVYGVLGILYESWIHPLTILSTLPSAGVGAVLALLVSGTEFSIIAMIGVILLIGIVKKNAIMMIDFALTANRTEGLSAEDAILKACRLRFRPIMMTTFSAILGAVPLLLDSGEGAELRRPLGIAIIGGLIVSQVLTLYTTPVVYVLLDRLHIRKVRATALSGAQ